MADKKTNRMGRAVDKPAPILQQPLTLVNGKFRKGDKTPDELKAMYDQLTRAK